MSFQAEAERSATFARALGMYEAACIRVQVCRQDMPPVEDIRRTRQQSTPTSLPTAERMREYVELFKAAIVSLEESAAAAEVYQEADAACRLGAGKAG